MPLTRSKLLMVRMQAAGQSLQCRSRRPLARLLPLLEPHKTWRLQILQAPGDGLRSGAIHEFYELSRWLGATVRGYGRFLTSFGRVYTVYWGPASLICSGPRAIRHRLQADRSTAGGT